MSLAGAPVRASRHCASNFSATADFGLRSEARPWTDMDRYGPAMSTPAAPDGKSRLRSVPVIVAILVLLGVGLAPIHPSSTEGTVIAVTGLVLLILPWFLGDAVLTTTFFGVGLVVQRGLFWRNLATELDRAPGAPEQAKAELDAALQRLDGGLRAKAREKIKNESLPKQLAYVRALLKTMEQMDRPFKRLLEAHETVVASFAALVGVAFLLSWTFMYLLIWSLESGAFSGLAPRPRLGEFLFISASGALGGTPEGVRALGAWSQAALTVEPLSFVVLVGVFVASLRASPTDPST